MEEAIIMTLIKITHLYKYGKKFHRNDFQGD